MDERPFDAAAIDEMIHGRLRLGVVVYLASIDSALFGELREAVDRIETLTRAASPAEQGAPT